MNRYLFLFFAFLIIIGCQNPVNTSNKPIENIIKVRLSGDPENLNFLLASDGTATELFKLLSIPFASFNPATYELSPTLIKRMPSYKEILTGEHKGRIAYDFEILEEATWDNGSPITAMDVLFTLKAIFNPHYLSPHRSLTSFIKHFEIDEQNPKKFRVYGVKYIIAGAVISNFEAMPKYVYDPDGLLDNFTFAELRNPANKERLAKDEKLKAFADKFKSSYHLNRPEGISYAGPYKIEKWLSGQEIVLSKKKNWWGDKLSDEYPLLVAYPDKIIYKIVKDINAAISLAKNDELDIIGKIPWSSFVNLKENEVAKENFNFFTPEKVAYRYIALNNNNPKFEDKRVRQALDYLFDRNQIYETVYYGTANPTIGPVHPSKPYYNKEILPRNVNVEKAKKLLKEAGWQDSNQDGIVDKTINGEQVEMNIDLIYGSGFEDFASISTIFKGSALKAGINIEPRTIAAQNYFKILKSKDFDAIISVNEWYPLHKDLYGLFSTKGSQNYSSFSNTEVDQLIKEIRFTIDESKLPPLYTKIQEIIHEETPCIFINTGVDRIIVNKKINNVRVTAVKPHYYLNEMSLKSVSVN